MNLFCFCFLFFSFPRPQSNLEQVRQATKIDHLVALERQVFQVAMMKQDRNRGAVIVVFHDSV